MSNRLFQSVIYQMKDAVERVIGVIDENSVIISCSELGKIGEIKQGIKDELAYSNDVICVNGYTYRSITVGVKSEYIVFVERRGQNGRKDLQNSFRVPRKYKGTLRRKIRQGLFHQKYNP